MKLLIFAVVFVGLTIIAVFANASHKPVRARGINLLRACNGMDKLAKKVAIRYAASDYFKVDDIVMFGKYKNHKGKVVGFGEDKWGNPTVEIEPIPKGRKQNKVFGLYKIWRADVKENALKEMAKEKDDE